jgi:hypothetical protein
MDWLANRGKGDGANRAANASLVANRATPDGIGRLRRRSK